jgi:uncharacterized Zn finger protein
MTDQKRPAKRCAECGRVFDLIFFRPARDKRRSIDRRTRPVWKGCEQTRRDTIKKGDPYLVKAKNSIRTPHRYGQSVEENDNQFSWSADEIADDMKHAFKNGCRL